MERNNQCQRCKLQWKTERSICNKKKMLGNKNYMYSQNVVLWCTVTIQRQSFNGQVKVKRIIGSNKIVVTGAVKTALKTVSKSTHSPTCLTYFDVCPAGMVSLSLSTLQVLLPILLFLYVLFLSQAQSAYSYTCLILGYIN